MMDKNQTTKTRITLLKELKEALDKDNTQQVEELSNLLGYTEEEKKWFSKGLTGYASIDQPHLIGRAEADYVTTDAERMTVFDYAYENNKDYPNQVAIYFHGNKIPYSAFFKNVEETYKALLHSGVKQGDIIGICSLSTPETIYLFYALSKLGATAHMLNPLMGKETLKSIDEDIPCKKYFVLDGMIPLITEVLGEKDVVELPTTRSMGKIIKFLADKKLKTPKNDCPTWDEFISGASKIKTDAFYEKTYRTSETDDFLIAYSSGTTGKPKGVCLSNKAFNLIVEKYRVEPNLGFSKNNIILNVIPPFFITSIASQIHTAIGFGLGLFISLDAVASEKKFRKASSKSGAFCTGYAMNNWIKIAEKGYSRAFRNMKYPVSGGEAVYTPVEKRVNEDFARRNLFYKATALYYKDVVLHISYGLSELGSSVTNTNNVFNSPGSSGIPLPKNIVGAFDMETNRELPYYQRGEIRVISDCAMNKYYGNLEATDEFFWENEQGKWGKTKDIGYVAENGEVFVFGRSSDSVLAESGDTIYLFDIKRELLNLPMIRDCEAITLGNPEKIVVVFQLDSPSSEENAVWTIDSFFENLLQQDKDYKLSKPFAYRIVKEFETAKSGKKASAFLKDENSTYYRITDGQIISGNWRAINANNQLRKEIARNS